MEIKLSNTEVCLVYGIIEKVIPKLMCFLQNCSKLEKSNNLHKLFGVTNSDVLILKQIKKSFFTFPVCYLLNGQQ